MNIEKVSERNFIYAVNYETIIAALSLSESSAVSLFDTISTHVSIYEPLVVHIKTYQQVCGVPSSLLIDTYLSVKKAFVVLKSNEYVITPIDEWYPKGLLKMHLPPPFLYVKGNVSLLKEPLTGITGAVNPTSQGITVTKEVVNELTQHNVGIISGLNKGVEGAVQLTNLSKNGKAIALLASPLHLVSTPAHASLQSFIGEHGLLISPFSPNKRHERWYISLQKELLAYICNDMIIPEERDGGGSLRCAYLVLNSHKHLYIYQHTLDNRSLLWPRKVAKSPFLVILKKGDPIIKKLGLGISKRTHKIEDTSQLSLFD
jgi:DNA processing protein